MQPCSIQSPQRHRPSEIKSKSRGIMFTRSSNIMINGGTFSSSIKRASRGMDILMEWVATGAFHNSDELYDAPKCHPRTRIAVLEDIMKWVDESESARDDFMLWLFGAAGAGKSAIAKMIAEIAAERDLLIADFFFSRTSPTRNTKDRFIATLAYQLTLSVPATRSYIEEAIERDPAIFNKNIQTQIDTLLLKPLQFISFNQIFPRQKLIIIDGLDECHNSQSQVAILEAIAHSFTQYKLPIIFLVASRPEPDLDASFNCNEPLRSIHRRLALDDSYQPDDDIRLFLSDRFAHIRRTHRMRSIIPVTWPSEVTLDTLVSKSSGQFIYASTVVKFVESRCHRPTARLNIILGISLPGSINPFSELDAIYDHILSSVDDIQITLRVLSLYVMRPRFVSGLHISRTPPEHFLSLEPGEIPLALMNLSSIVTYDEISGNVEILHASLVDFLSDKRRSTTFYIDMASTCTDFVRRILQYVKGPDGIQAGNIFLFREVIELFPCVLNDQLQSDILSFDLDAFINASIRWLYYKEHPSPVLESILDHFDIWRSVLHNACLEDRAKNEALDRLHKSLEARIQIYQFDWRLHLLLTLATNKPIYFSYDAVPYCRCLDILLEMLDDHDLHIVDQNALDLRHPHTDTLYVVDTIRTSSYVDGHTYASAALHCMRFLSNPPSYSEMSPILAEWEATCLMSLAMLCVLLPLANMSPTLAQFISNHDFHPEIQKHLGAYHVLEVNMYILAFLSRANICVNWRIISAIQRSPVINDQPSSKLDENADSERPSPQKDSPTTRDLIKQHLDPCCSKVYHYISAW